MDPATSITISSSLKASGMMKVFNSKPCADNSRKLRSRVDKRRLKLDQLDQLFKDLLPLLQHLSKSNSSSARVFKDYLMWVQTQLKAFEEKPQAYTTQSLEREINNFDSKLKLAFRYLNIISTVYTTNNISVVAKQKLRISFVSNAQVQFTSFIQKGLKAYPAFLDVYDLWLSPSELDEILVKKEYDYLSYSTLTIIAKFILPEKSQEYKDFYSTFLERSKSSIAQCYVTPSIEGIVSLCFMTMIYIADYEFETSLTYFTSALKMFQIIDQEKSPKHFLSIFKEANLSKIETLRKALTLISIIFHTIMPEAPPFEFDSNPISLSFNEDINRRKLDYAINYGESFQKLGENKSNHSEVENKLIGFFTTIFSHIQLIRKRYRPFDQPELIPVAELRLPLDSYSKIFNFLLDLEAKFENDQSNINDLLFSKGFNFISYMEYDTSVNVESKKNQKSHILTFIHSIFIFLIYPSVLIAPKTILFPINEMQILFKTANTVVQYYINVISCYKVLSSQPLNLESSQNLSQENIKMPSRRHSSHPMQITYPLYVYLNLISLSQDSPYSFFSEDDILTCKTVTLDVLKMLKQLSKSEVENFSIEANFAITKLTKSLPNFNLPQQFLEASMSILGTDAPRQG